MLEEKMIQAAKDEFTLEELTAEGEAVNGIKCIRTDFERLTLSKCRFEGCDFTGASFTNCTFENCSFTGCRFEKA